MDGLSNSGTIFRLSLLWDLGLTNKESVILNKISPTVPPNPVCGSDVQKTTFRPHRQITSAGRCIIRLFLINIFLSNWNLRI